MKPFRTSTSARVLSAAIAFALAGAGVTAVAGFDPHAALPIVFLVAAGGGIVGLLAGVYEQTARVALLALLLPLAFWPFTMLAALVATRYPVFGWLEIAVGCVVAGASAIASYTTRRAEHPASAPVSRAA